VIFCISTAAVAVAWTEPSPTPGHIVSRIRRQSVESSAIAKIGYSKRRHILEIEFVNGAVYRYLDVPVTVYQDLMAAESKAGFYDSNIKGRYRSVLIRSRQTERSRGQHDSGRGRPGSIAARISAVRNMLAAERLMAPTGVSK
jgi:hypothetical protein